MESFFFNELAPKVQQSIAVDKKNIFISGLSMGGYGALHLFLRKSDYFNTAASTSGALEIDAARFRQTSQHFWQSDRMLIDGENVFGKPEQHNWQENNIASLLKNMKKIKPFLIDCGTEDILYPITVRLKTLSDSLKIPVTFISQPGDHNTEYWSKSIEYHFVYFRQHLVK